MYNGLHCLPNPVTLHLIACGHRGAEYGALQGSKPSDTPLDCQLPTQLRIRLRSRFAADTPSPARAAIWIVRPEEGAKYPRAGHTQHTGQCIDRGVRMTVCFWICQPPFSRMPRPQAASTTGTKPIAETLQWRGPIAETLRWYAFWGHWITHCVLRYPPHGKQFSRRIAKGTPAARSCHIAHQVPHHCIAVELRMGCAPLHR